MAEKTPRRAGAHAPARARLQAEPHREPERDLAESPLAWLFRRKDKDGRPMLTEA